MNGKFYSVVPSSILHVKPLSAHLRPAACLTLRSFGLDARHALREAFLGSSYCRTALVEGKPVAMWGIIGVSLSDHAVAWLALGDSAVRWPLAIIRCAMAELDQMSKKFAQLYATVDRDDERAMAFARTLGFVDQDAGSDSRLLLTFGSR